MRYALLLAVALGIAPKLAGPTKAQPLEQRDAETIAVPIGTSVRVEIEAGSVTVRAWDRDELSIRSPDRSAYLAEYQAGAVLIRPGGESGSPLELELQVPRSADLAVDTGRARVDVTGVEGAVMVRTREGAVRGRDLGGKVNLSSESGRISYDLVRQPRGDIRLDSVEGQIECRIPNSVNFKTVVEAGAGWSWDREVRFGVGRLEKQLGSGGPTLHATSLEGKISIYLDVPQRISAGYRETNTIDNGVQAGALGASVEPVFTVDASEVNINVSVKDALTDQMVGDLKQTDFLVYEDGDPQTVEYFQSSVAPFHLLLLLDVSQSTEGYMGLIKRASIQFTEQIRENDRVAVATFNGDAQLVQAFTESRDEVVRAIREASPSGYTAFYDALSVSLTEYVRDVPGRKAIIVFTDGIDNRLIPGMNTGSSISFESVFRQVQDSVAVIYPIFLRSKRPDQPVVRSGGQQNPFSVVDRLSQMQRRPGSAVEQQVDDAYLEVENQLRKIADQTGGRMYVPGGVEDLSGVYSEVAAELRTQYTIGYTPTNERKDGAWRSLSVEVKNHPLARVRTRDGYYATGP